MRAGDELGRYRLVAEIGSGGMGTVWSAEGPTGRVALKVVHPHLAGTPEFAERFRREGEIGMRVRDENVVATLEVGTAETEERPAHFLVMELVEGRTLRALLTELGKVPEELCLHIGREVAKGLAAIHAAGAIHRDLKPDNVLITRENVVKVMDLGVARTDDSATRLSQPGAFVGSFHYAAPEQVSGRTPAIRRSASDEAGSAKEDLSYDHRIDLHALGLVLYELATGRNPFDDSVLQRTISRLLHDKPPRPSEANPQLSVFFDELVLQLLEKDPGRRFATAQDVVHVLDDGEDSTWWRHRATSLRAATRRPLRRMRILRETALHGREAEIAKLGALWESVKAGDGQVVLLSGEDGIGKSRLIDEFAALRQEAGDDLNFLHGSFPPSGAATPTSAFVAAYREQFGAEDVEAALASYLRETPLLVPAFGALLRGDVLPPGAEPLTKESLQTVFVHATRALAEERPTILLVDDLDFAPPDGRALFAALSFAAPGHRVLVVGIVRPEADERWLADLERHGPVTRMALARLGPKDLSRLLVEAFRSERLAEELAFQIAAKSDGNPFFVFEILRGLREGRFIERKGDGTWVSTQAIREIKIPSSVQELVAARLGGLSADERNLLDVAACCGLEFDPLLAGAALGLSRIGALQRLAWIEKSHRLVRGAGRMYVFDHNQIHESLYAALPELLREEYHAAIAEVIAARAAPPGGADSAVIARHFLAGRRPDRAMAYLTPALDHLKNAQSYAAAVALIGWILAAPGFVSGRERLDLLLRQIRALAIVGPRDAERTALDEALVLADEVGEALARAQVRVALGWHLTRVSRARDAVKVLDEAIAISVPAGELRLDASASGNLGLALWDLGRYDDARVRIERQLEILRGLGDASGEDFAAGNLGLVEYSRARYAEARACHERHLAAAKRSGDRRAVAAASGNLGIVFTSLGCFDDARAHVEVQLAASREVGDRRGESIALGNLGNVHYALGRWADARDAIERGVRLSREIGDRVGESSALVNLGPLAGQLGDPERAADALEASLSISREVGARYQEGYGLYGLAELADAAGDGPRAAGLHERALALRREMGHRDGVAESLVALGRIRSAAGELAAARSHLDEAASLARDLGLASVAALAAAHLALLPGGDAVAAVAAFAANESRIMARERMEARWLLATATDDPSHAAEARRLLDVLVANAPPECREKLVANVPLHRDIARSGGPRAPR